MFSYSKTMATLVNYMCKSFVKLPLLINSRRNVSKTVHIDINNRSDDRANPKARNLLHNYSAVSI